MTKRALMLLTTALVAFPVIQAEAGSRYSTPPAITLSPDLTSPWVLQLKREPAPRQKKRVKVYQPQKKQRTYQVRKKQRVYHAKKKRRKTQQSWGVSSRQHRAPTGIFALFGNQRSHQPVRQRVQPRRQQAFASVSTPAPQPSNAQAAAYIQEQASQRPIDPRYLPQVVNFETSHKPGTILIHTNTRYLYLVMGNGKARRYGVGVGKQGFEWSGSQKISRKATWPSWRPPKEMIAREAKKGRHLPEFMEGGPANPLGARALYLGDTLYRIHGTNQPWTIGQAVSSGCIRMRNEDVMDLYERAKIGAKVVVS
ncbi:MAG: L,D-transpeptidase [Pseudomonadota bacterium]